MVEGLPLIPAGSAQWRRQGGRNGAAQQQSRQHCGIALQDEHKHGTEQGSAAGGSEETHGANGAELGLTRAV